MPPPAVEITCWASSCHPVINRNMRFTACGFWSELFFVEPRSVSNSPSLPFILGWRIELAFYSSLSLPLSLSLSLYIYIYIEREREREREGIKERNGKSVWSRLEETQYWDDKIWPWVPRYSYPRNAPLARPSNNWILQTCPLVREGAHTNKPITF
jgi:hypothetical protein